MTGTRLVRRFITAVVFTIAGLTFSFGFASGYALGVRLGVSPWAAWLVAPAVDLSVVALLVVLQLARTTSVNREGLATAHVLLGFCGLMTLALNTAYAVVTGAYGRALFDAIAPLLLIGWSEVGPRVLTLLDAVPDVQDESTTGVPPTGTVPDELAAVPGPSAGLVQAAFAADAEHRARTGRPVTRDRLRASLRVSNAMAGELLRTVRDARAEVG